VEQRGFYRISNAEKHFENRGSKEVKTLTWFPMRNSHDGVSYRELVEEYPKTRQTIFAGFILMLEVASKCSPRWALMRKRGRPQTPASLARCTGFAPATFEVAIPVCLDLGWMEEVSLTSGLIIAGGADLDAAGFLRPDRDIPREHRDGTAEGRENTATPRGTDRHTERERLKNNVLYASRVFHNVDNSVDNSEGALTGDPAFVCDVSRLMLKVFGPGWRGRAEASLPFAMRCVRLFREGVLSGEDLWGTTGDCVSKMIAGRVRTLPRYWAKTMKAVIDGRLKEAGQNANSTEG
jgi:hypothetical protein